MEQKITGIIIAAGAAAAVALFLLFVNNKYTRLFSAVLLMTAAGIVPGSIFFLGEDLMLHWSRLQTVVFWILAVVSVLAGVAAVALNIIELLGRKKEAGQNEKEEK